MYVWVTAGAYRVHTKCPPGELLKGEVRCLGGFGRKAAENCAAHQSIMIPFLGLYNTVEMRPLASSQRTARLTGVSMYHLGITSHCCHYLLLLIKSTAW